MFIQEVKMEILKLMQLGLQSFSNGITEFLLDPIFIINPITILVVFVIASQYKSMVSTQKQMYKGKVRTKLIDLVITSMLAGILAGLAGTLIITVLGITFLKLNGLLTVIIVSLLLMFFINPRYVCLSYSGGILSILSLIFAALLSNGFVDKSNSIILFIQDKLDFDVTALLIIIAIMHFTEALLMWIDGHRGAVPVFMKRDGKLVGGFVMQRLWVLPIIFYILVKSTDVIGQTVPTPGWWPLFGPNMTGDALKKAVFGATPSIAMLGYNDFSISTPVKTKVRRSAFALLCYSIILLMLSLISYKIYAFKIIAALFAPLAHEFIILNERYKESTGVPIWSFAEDGVIVVDTIPKSPAEKIGILSGDKVIGINNMPVNSIEDIVKIMSNYINYIWIEVINLKGEKRTLEFSNYQTGIDELGIITVPKNDENVLFVEHKTSNLFNSFIDKFRNKNLK
jgi:hypothetical protein